MPGSGRGGTKLRARYFPSSRINLGLSALVARLQMTVHFRDMPMIVYILIFVVDRDQGTSCRPAGKGFCYRDPMGKPLTTRDLAVCHVRDDAISRLSVQ